MPDASTGPATRSPQVVWAAGDRGRGRARRRVPARAADGHGPRGPGGPRRLRRPVRCRADRPRLVRRRQPVRLQPVHGQAGRADRDASAGGRRRRRSARRRGLAARPGPGPPAAAGRRPRCRGPRRQPGERPDHLRRRAGVRAARALRGQRWNAAPRPVRLALAAGCAALATWASPVAGLFTGLAGAALLLAALRRVDGPGRALPGGWRSERPLAEGRRAGRGARRHPGADRVALRQRGHPAVLGRVDADQRRVRGAGGGRAAASRRVLRVGALLTVLLLVGAYYVPSPIGSTRCGCRCSSRCPCWPGTRRCPARGLPGCSPRRLVAVPGDAERRHPGRRRRERGPAFYRPLVAELDRRRARRAGSRWCRCATTGSRRTCHRPCPWPVAGSARSTVDRNALFYDGTLSAQTYEHGSATRRSPTWRSLRTLPPTGGPATRPRWSAAICRTCGRSGATRPGGCTRWPIRAAGRRPRPAGHRRPGRGPATATPGDVPVKVRWSRWLSLDGPDGCLRPGADGWTEVRVRAAGDYSISSSLAPANHC